MGGGDARERERYWAREGADLESFVGETDEKMAEPEGRGGGGQEVRGERCWGGRG